MGLERYWDNELAGAVIAVYLDSSRSAEAGPLTAHQKVFLLSVDRTGMVRRAGRQACNADFIRMAAKGGCRT